MVGEISCECFGCLARSGATFKIYFAVQLQPVHAKFLGIAGLDMKQKRLLALDEHSRFGFFDVCIGVHGKIRRVAVKAESVRLGIEKLHRYVGTTRKRGERERERAAFGHKRKISVFGAWA